jgi:lipoprotein-releasing system permease protein
VSIEFNIAKRYLFSKNQVSLISILNVISISGITIGTALLIIVLSVFNGFFDVVQKLLLTYDPDIKIEASGSNKLIITDDLIQQLEQHPNIKQYTTYVEGKALLGFEGNKDKVVIVKGIHLETYFPLIEHYSKQGLTTPSINLQNGRPGMLIGEDLSSLLNLKTGDRISLLSPESIKRSITSLSNPGSLFFDLRGSYTLASIYEGSIVFVDLKAAQRLFNLRNGVTGIDIRISSPDMADNIKSDLESRLGSDYSVRTWYDLQKPLYDIMYLEKWASYFILSLIIAVAVLNIVGSLTMTVIQKQRDIGILLTLGLQAQQIRRMYMLQGLFIGLIGSVVGGSLGLGIVLLQEHFGLVKLQGSAAFLIETYPVLIKFSDVLSVLIVTIILSIAAAIYPALRASNIEPANAVRYE